MRFYGICFCLMALFLAVLPLLTTEPMKESTELQTEEPLTAVVDEVFLPQAGKDDMVTVSQYPLNKVQQFQIKNAVSGNIDVVDAETYVLGAVCSEMPATFHLEALKAQAVSARTWAVYQQLWQKKHPSAELDGADFQADPLNWKGYVTEEQARERFGEKFDEYWSLLTRAVKETEGQILCHDGQPIAAAYHAISAGKTEAAQYVWGSELAYLQAVDSRGDELAPGFEESRSVTDAEIKTIFSAATLEASPTSWLEIQERSPSGYVTEIQVGDLLLRGQDFRTALALRSSHFTIVREEGGFRITTKGYGHGAGLSQYGADFMARQGKNHAEILAHFYQGTQLCQW